MAFTIFFWAEYNLLRRFSEKNNFVHLEPKRQLANIVLKKFCQRRLSDPKGLYNKGEIIIDKHLNKYLSHTVGGCFSVEAEITGGCFCWTEYVNCLIESANMLFDWCNHIVSCK